MAEAGAGTERAEQVGLPAIFAAFFRLGITSFGGGTAAWLYREIVQRRRWIDAAAFASDLALGRVMPGSGGVNLTVQTGQRLRGATGAAAAVLGLLSGPLAIVLGLAAAWARIGPGPVLHAVLDGVGAAAVGLTFAAGLQLLPRGSPSAAPLAVTLATVISVGVMRWPMIPVVLSLTPISIAIAWSRARSRGRDV
jgi:chromate transporter